MPVFDVAIVPREIAEAIDRYRDGEDGLGPKIARPNVQPRSVQIVAGSMREALILAVKFYPGWAASSNIMKARNA